MKRSEINRAVREALEFLDKHRFMLPALSLIHISEPTRQNS